MLSAVQGSCSDEAPQVIYTPESFVFGGPSGMCIAHEHNA